MEKKMKRILMLLLLIVCVPTLCLGAQIYGSLRVDNASVGAGVLVRIECPEGAYEGKTDAYGSYTVPLRVSKKCSLLVHYNGQWSGRFDVYPYADPVRYDFDLLRQKDGSIGLRRR
jgi:hypothetical protein